MNWDEFERSFKAVAQSAGVDSAAVDLALAYAKPLSERGIPVLFDGEHLAAVLGYPIHILKSALDSPAGLYHTFFVPKRTGGFRRIDAPRRSLAAMQRWILTKILDRCEVSPSATAFVRGRSIKLNAELHRGKKRVLSLDVKDFFPSLTTTQVRRAIRRLGYAASVEDLLVQLTTMNDGLPQGAPTSPALSNLVMAGVDRRLQRFARIAHLSYSRYADDLTFSGNVRVGQVVKVVEDELSSVGLQLNHDKTRLMCRHQRQEVTGLVVNNEVSFPTEVRRRLRQEAYYIKKFGEASHLERQPTIYKNHLGHLRGLAQFLLFINPSDKDAINALDWIPS